MTGRDGLLSSPGAPLPSPPPPGEGVSLPAIEPVQRQPRPASSRWGEAGWGEATLPIVYEPEHVLHRPRTEVLYGRPLPNPERPERVEAVRRALRGTRWEAGIVAPRAYPLELAELAHEPAYVAHLHARAAEADTEGLDSEWFPYVFGRDRSLDTGTPIQRGTVACAWRSASVALTAADLAREGAPAVFGLCRPPGHHAAAGASGGYCYFNNAALAAARLMNTPVPGPAQSAAGAASDAANPPRSTAPPLSPATPPGSSVAGRVAILDLDIHHGNGTQDIFYRSDRVLYCSLHGDPEWAYPPHTGFPGETVDGSGDGFTFNQPLPVGAGWPEYAAALERALDRIARFAPAYIVLSQGFDTFEGDRWGGFLLHAPDYAESARRVRAIGVPVVALLEGGYEPANIAAGSLALIEGLAS